MTEFYWRVKRTNNGVYEYGYSTTEPTVAFSDSGSIVSGKTVILKTRGTNNVTDGSIYLEATKSSSTAIRLNASNTAGGVQIDTGTGGLSLACNANTGPVSIGNASGSKILTIGNSSGSTKLIHRYGTGGRTKTQLAPVSYSNGNQSASLSDLLAGFMYMTPTANRTVTLPSASTIVSGLSGVAVNDSFDFTITNLTTSLGDPLITVVLGTGGTSIGRLSIAPATGLLVAYQTSGCGTFKLRVTNITASSEAYEVYRIA